MRTILFAGLVALAGSTATMTGAADTSESGAVTLQSGELPAGPNFALYKTSCLGCHTSSYVIKTPKSPRSYWEMEVKKMVDLYNAPINEQDQKSIVDYLVSVRGVAEKPAN